MTVRLRTLGCFSITSEGDRFPAASGQPVRSALLLLLALEREITREKAMALLWPESDDMHARQALRQTLYLLRRDLGSEWLESDQKRLLATSQLVSDAGELIVAADSGDHEGAAALFRGPFLAGINLVESQPFQFWCDQWKGRLDRLHRQSRRAVIEARAAGGDAEGALDAAREWLELDPLEDEAMHRMLELLIRLGRGGEAIREFRRFEALLEAEDLTPLDQTLALVDRIQDEGGGVPPLSASDGSSPGDDPAAPGPEPDTVERGRSPVPWPGGVRKRWLVPVAVILAVLLGIHLTRDRGSQSDPIPERIMVLPLVNETGDTALNGIGLLAADWITHTVVRMGPLQAVPFLDVRQMLGAGLEPQEAALHRQAGTLLTGRYFRVGDSLELHVRITDLRKGELWHVLDPVRIVVDAPEQGLRELQARVGGSLGVRFNPSLALPDPSALEPPSYPAFRALMEAAAYISREDWPGAIPHLERAAGLDSTFYRARLGLVSAWGNVGRPARADSVLRSLDSHRENFSPYESILYRGLRASLDGNLMERLAAARVAARLDPGGTVHYVSANAALAAGRPREAIELYSTLDPQCPWAPGWLGAWRDWTAAFHLLGNHEREIEEARRARELHPHRLQALFFELRALIGLDRLETVRTRLSEEIGMPAEGSWTRGTLLYRLAAELAAHGHPEAGTDLAEDALLWYDMRPAEERTAWPYRIGRLRALLLAGRMPEGQEMIAELRREDPHRLDLLGIEGVFHAGLGNAPEARERSRELDGRRAPYQAGAVDYWRGAIAAWSGESEQALTLLWRAYGEGMPRGPDLHADPFLQPLWGLPEFRNLIAEDL
jgi:DNA-binding SARP family transcriptional activator/tetratricopeptide (TPR) repeat protein